MKRLFALMLLASAATCQAQPMISVGLLRAYRPESVSVSCPVGLITRQSERITRTMRPLMLRASGRCVQVCIGSMRQKLYSSLTLEGCGGAPIRVGSISYRGRLRVSAREGRLVIVNEIPLEDYVRGVVASEIRSDWPTEALKAQAVVARSLAVARMGRHRSEGFDVCDTTHCQVYKGKTGETPATDSAVRATAHEILTKGDAAVEPLYCSTCGGTMTNAFGSRSVGFSRQRTDLLNGASACKSSPHFAWTSRVMAVDLAEALKSDRRTNPGAHLHGIRIVQRDPSGRAKFVEIKGEKNKEVDGYVLWNVVCRRLGWATLKSGKFDVGRAGGAYVFRGHGLGHGIGMCQWGAKKRAESGWDYRRILEFYYPGCRLRERL